MIVLVLLYVTAIASATKVPFYSLSEGPQPFEDFIEAHNKVYSSDEEKAMRYEIFLKNLEEINQLNAKNEYTEFGVNKFTDLTPEEFLKMQTPFKAESSEYLEIHEAITPEIKSRNEVVEIPTNFDWRDKNVVTSVKDQGPCNSAYAFSALGNIEGLFAIKTGNLIDLSAQQVIDCNVFEGGCLGGVPQIVIRYLMDEGPMLSESYPYNASENDCMYDPEKVAVNVTSYQHINRSEEDIAAQLVAIGPLSIFVDATPLHHYKSGVLNGKDCQNYYPNHPVLLVGYGVDSESGLFYWLVKNSWGADFGEQGYFRMQRGVVCLDFPAKAPITAVIG